MACETPFVPTPPTSDLPQCDSPSNLFSLERQLGGEISKTLEKATKSVLKQIDLVNQQSEPVAETVVPEPVPVTDSEQTVTVTVSEQQQQQTHQTSPKQTSISTPTPTQPETQYTPQKAIPEPVVETAVAESVPATKSE